MKKQSLDYCAMVLKNPLLETVESQWIKSSLPDCGTNEWLSKLTDDLVESYIGL
ncbi:MAG: hypothetical protein PHQ23_12710 [Candidatus Wallbacteria bacterium]|nr:hypothetical protein [Candidatus Wallbacteria bacterium]